MAPKIALNGKWLRYEGNRNGVSVKMAFNTDRIELITTSSKDQVHILLSNGETYILHCDLDTLMDLLTKETS